MKTLPILAAALVLSGCATIVDGTTQQIRLSSNAENAKCSISHEGVLIVPSLPVPAGHIVQRRPGNLMVTCDAPGYESRTVALVAGRNPLAVAPVLPVFPQNSGYDAAFGGLAEYQDSAYIHLKRASSL